MKTKFILLLLLFCLGSRPGLQAQSAPGESMLQKLKWRAIGPANMGGRVTDIDGLPGDPSTFYVSAADGGVFKTTNGGVSFEALFTKQSVYGVGALTISPSDPEVLWLGSGEGDPRNSVGYGNGVYRSTDGGKTWTHLGLAGTDRIKRIVVHPTNPDVACACAMGREWGSNAERGVFRTTDGGKTWEKTLYLDESTGCSDIVMDPTNPRILYAGMWTFLRKPWRFDEGGKNTAVYRSMDGGKTWSKIMKGLPEKPMARIGLAIAESQPSTVYMITEYPNTSGTLFRSDDRGENWRLVNKDPEINFRPFYYSDIRVDPTNPEIVYSLAGGLYKSSDGGKTFKTIADDVHGDHQSLWIDPKNPKRILSGSDGGFQVSWDEGATFDIINNVELSQFYQIFVDNQSPYMVYGGFQDNGTWVGPSNSLHAAGILKRHWKQLAGGDGYYAVPVPGSEHEIYANLQGGVIFHVNTKTGAVRNIHPYPNKTGSAGDAIADHKYRFNWDSPIHVSPHDGNVVYTGGNVLFKSSDRGNTWEVISPDLSTNDKSKQQSSGGEIYQDNTAAEFHCTILSVAESPLEKGVIWCGTDDGNVQITRDAGKTWTNVKNNITGLPAFAWVGKIHASEHAAGTAFVAVDQHRMDDYRAHGFMTTDYGKTWTKISAGLPQNDWLYVVRQDPKNQDLLYAGMEHGIFASWDKGKTWAKINGDLPPASVRDLRVQAREGDLIVGTHGRGAWILDDISTLQNWKNATGKTAHLFEPRPATRWQYYGLIEDLGNREYAAKNPTPGAYLNFYVPNDVKGAVKVTISDAANKVIREISDTTIKAGINRIVWDLRGEEGVKLNAATRGWGSGAIRPWVMPGTYQISMKIGDQELKSKVTVNGDSRTGMSAADYQTQYNAVIDLHGLQSETNKLLNNTEQMLAQLKGLADKVKFNGGSEPSAETKAALEAIGKAQKAIDALRDTWRRPPPAMSYRQKPQLREEIRSLMSAINEVQAKPTVPQLARIEELREELAQAKRALAKAVSDHVEPLNKQYAALPVISIGEK
jgi:photosystem II stability/assembly factor-like uncharacterized protein